MHIKRDPRLGRFIIEILSYDFDDQNPMILPILQFITAVFGVIKNSLI